MISFKLFFLCALTVKLVLSGGDGLLDQVSQLSLALSSIAGKYLETEQNFIKIEELVRKQTVESLAILSNEIPRSEESSTLQKLFAILHQYHLKTPPTIPIAPEGRNIDDCSRIVAALSNLNTTRSNFIQRKASTSEYLNSLKPVLDELKTKSFSGASPKLSESLDSSYKIYEILQTLVSKTDLIESGADGLDDVWNGLSIICPNVNSTVDGKFFFAEIGNFFNSAFKLVNDLATSVRNVVDSIFGFLNPKPASVSSSKSAGSSSSVSSSSVASSSSSVGSLSSVSSSSIASSSSSSKKGDR